MKKLSVVRWVACRRIPARCIGTFCETAVEKTRVQRLGHERGIPSRRCSAISEGMRPRARWRRRRLRQIP